MSISFSCSSCQAKLRTKPELAGKRVKCPKCGQAVQVPSGATDSAPISKKETATPKTPVAPTSKSAAAVTVPPQKNRREIEMLYIFFVTDRPGKPQGSFPYDLVDTQMGLGGELIKFKEQNREFIFDKIPKRAESDFESQIPEIVAQRHPGCDFAAKSVEIEGQDDKQYFVVVFRSAEKGNIQGSSPSQAPTKDESPAQLLCGKIADVPASPAAQEQIASQLEAVGEPVDKLNLHRKLQLGEELAQKGQHQNAVQIFDQILQQHPGFTPALISKGTVFAETGKSDQALICFDRALQIEPNSYKALANKANLLTALSRPDDALPLVNRAIALNASDANSWLVKGTILAMLKQQSEAIDCYDQCLSLEPGNAAAWFNKGRTLGTVDPGEALKCFDKAHSLGVAQAGEVAAMLRQMMRDMGL